MWPVLLDWGPLRLHSYGLMVAAGFLCALILAQRSGEKASLTPGQMVDLALICLVGGLVGGRLLYVLIHATYFRLNPAEIFMIHKGGLAFFGALAGGFLAGAFWVRRWGRSVLEVSDFLIVYVPLAHAFGRIGCFLNGCCWGTPFGAAWAVHFPHLDHPVHPVQLYAVLTNLLLFALLLVIRKRHTFPGQVLLSYGMLYGVSRFGLEFFRGDSPHSLLGRFTGFQVMAGALVLISLGTWMLLKKRGAGSQPDAR